MTQLPKISVVTVSFNHADFIRDTIDSVASQQYPNLEHIVVDGGSRDGTIEILRETPNLSWTSEPDRGISDALNKGFTRATGDIIVWLNSDDWLAPGALHAIAGPLSHHPVLLTNVIRTDREKREQEVIRNVPRSIHDLMRYWLPNAWLAQPGVFLRRDALESIRLPSGKYVDDTFDYAMDHELFLRLAAKYPFTQYLDQV
jgi:glycosyltransferase involved in cell wall biosynthesis